MGGFNGQEVLSSAEEFDPVTNQWAYILPVTSARSGVSFVVYRNYLYTLGGFDGLARLSSGKQIFIWSSYAYNTQSFAWCLGKSVYPFVFSLLKLLTEIWFNLVLKPRQKCCVNFILVHFNHNLTLSIGQTLSFSR